MQPCTTDTLVSVMDTILTRHFTLRYFEKISVPWSDYWCNCWCFKPQCPLDTFSLDQNCILLHISQKLISIDPINKRRTFIWHWLITRTYGGLVYWRTFITLPRWFTKIYMCQAALVRKTEYFSHKCFSFIIYMTNKRDFVSLSSGTYIFIVAPPPWKHSWSTEHINVRNALRVRWGARARELCSRRLR